MTLWLIAHPDCEPPPIRIAVELSRPRPGALSLQYLVTGAIVDLRVPAPAPPRRSERLWETTCFEAFLAGEGDAYTELNFSPSGEWAAYRFGAYRTGMADAALPPPRTIISAAADRLELRAEIRLERRRRGRIGLSAVIEDQSGAKSYWALTHVPGPPDFHHPDCFAAELPPPASP